MPRETQGSHLLPAFKVIVVLITGILKKWLEVMPTPCDQMPNQVKVSTTGKIKICCSYLYM